jgi:Skp family chaperone for outer membrane proteins
MRGGNLTGQLSCRKRFIFPKQVVLAGAQPGTNHDLVTDDRLTARSADVKTLFNGQVTLNRKTAVLAMAAAAGLMMFGFLEAQAPTQGPHPAGANASKYNIAVVDISFIFKKHERFKSTMEQMKKEMEGIEAELKADRAKIADKEQARNQFNVGSAEYKKADEEIARQMAEFNLKMGRLRKEFLEREAKVYYQTYLEVVDAVKYYAKRQNIGLVLRFNGEPVDPNRRDDVLREINKPVVVQDQIDITPDVLTLINRDQQAGGQAGTQARQPSSQLPTR